VLFGLGFPLVIVLLLRATPSRGLPTDTQQAEHTLKGGGEITGYGVHEKSRANRPALLSSVQSAH
jgi:hypothetical protein